MPPKISTPSNSADGNSSDRGRSPLPEGFRAIWLCVAIDLLGFGIMLPILPLYAERFGASPATVGLLVASFSIAQLLFSPLMGRLSDRIGRRPVLILSLAGTAFGSLMTGVAWSLPLLFAGRIIDGISGASVSVAQAAVLDVAPPEQRARLLGLLGAAFGVGFVGGPALGALAAFLGGPQVPFLLVSLIAGVNALVAAKRLPETKPTRTARTTSSFALASSVARVILVAFLALVGFSGFEATFALFGKSRLHFDYVSTGIVFMLIGLMITLVQVKVVHPVVNRFGDTGTLRIGLTLNAFGLIVLTQVHSWWLLAVSVSALTVGHGLVTPAVALVLASRIGPHRRGEMLGIQQSVGSLARAVGPIAGGYAFGHFGMTFPYVVAAILMIVAGWLAS